MADALVNCVAGQLHTVAGVAREADGDGFEFLGRMLSARRAGFQRGVGNGHEILIRLVTLRRSVTNPTLLRSV